MLIPVSWTVSETVTMPARKREKRERWREGGGMEARWRECEQNRDGEGVWQADVQPVDHRDTWP